MDNTKLAWLVTIVVIAIVSIVIVGNFKDLSVAIPVNLKENISITPYEGWREFTSESAQFSAKFPAIPQNAKDTSLDKSSQKNLLYDMYVSEKWDGTLFVVTSITYPNEIRNDEVENALKSFLSDIVSSNPENELISAQETRFWGHNALDFLVKTNQSFIEGKAFIDGKKLYFLSHITDGKDQKKEEFTYFVDSFRLLTHSNSEKR